MELVENYMLDDTLRHALNELAKKTFWIDMEIYTAVRFIMAEPNQ